MTAKCWPLRMPPTAKAVLMSLADHAGDDGQCWPSIDTICDRTCFGRDAVIDATVWLEGASALIANRENGRKTTYRITPDQFNPAFFLPSRRAAQRALTSRAEPPRPVGQNPEPVGQSNRSGRTDDQSGKTEHQSGKTSKPVGQTDTNRNEPSLNHQGTTNAKPSDGALMLSGFVAFWALYPKKVAKPAAFRAWQALKADSALEARILAAVAAQKKSPDWVKENRRYVPHPSTYLNQARWEGEELEPVAANTRPDWVLAAGFTHVAEAQNARCHIGNYREFKDGKRMPAEAHA
ncbi:MAG: helix-turn-helix domain-containing protein [Comamonadaceae bacterium]|nr:MAG: helix-turn-helix domain-containing protein [Comamonadaceae bacterium]